MLELFQRKKGGESSSWEGEPCEGGNRQKIIKKLQNFQNKEKSSTVFS